VQNLPIQIRNSVFLNGALVPEREIVRTWTIKPNLTFTQDTVGDDSLPVLHIKPSALQKATHYDISVSCTSFILIASSLLIVVSCFLSV
jgi:hypothetical protein